MQTNKHLLKPQQYLVATSKRTTTPQWNNIIKINVETLPSLMTKYCYWKCQQIGLPIFHPRNRFRDLLSPSPNLPVSSIVRDPFWWDVDDLVPFRATSVPRASSPVARDSYLSPVKNRYLWSKHPARPLTRKLSEWFIKSGFPLWSYQLRGEIIILGGLRLFYWL